MNIIRKKIATPISEMIACSYDKFICMLEFSDRKSLEKEFRELEILFNTKITDGNNPILELIEIELEKYFEGNLTTFTSIPIVKGTDFQMKVWNELLKIPYGKTWSYKEEAESMNNPKAIRAVANANGRNRISILIPCHRVIGNNGSLTGYGGGLDRKSKLLELEKKRSE